MKKLNVKLIKKQILKSGVTLVTQVTEHIECTECNLRYTEMYNQTSTITLVDFNALVDYEEVFSTNGTVTLVVKEEKTTACKCLVCSCR